MVHRPSVQKLVKPLRKLSLLTTTPSKTNLTLVPEEDEESDILQRQEREQDDLITGLPYELALYVFSLLCFDELVRVQLTCRAWCRIARDPSLWKIRCRYITQNHADLSTFNDDIMDTTGRNRTRRSQPLVWPTRYCRLQTRLNWKLGAVQRVHLISDHSGSRVLSVKLKEKLLVVLSEDNAVRLYEHGDNGFGLRHTWQFGDPTQQQNRVECVDLLPEINTMAVALRGSKCIFYDTLKPSSDPIQVLKGGTHAWFVPDSISLSRNYFVVSGRKPSAVFLWKWRKGVRLSNKAFDNQPHSVQLSGDYLITASVDGTVHVFDILDEKNVKTFQLPPCSIPTLDYDGGLYLSVAPFTARCLHQFAWHPQQQQTSAHDPCASPSSSSTSFTSSSSLSSTLAEDDDAVNPPRNQPTPQPSTSAPHPTQHHRVKRRLSSSFGLFSLAKKKWGCMNTSTNPSSLSTSAPATNQERIRPSSTSKLARIRRHSSYNDYGYACQARTEQYIKQKMEQGLLSTNPPTQRPDFDQPLTLRRTIRTTPLGNTALEIVNVTSYQGHISTVNRRGDIAIYKKDGTMAARVQHHGQHSWMEKSESPFAREDDDYSDGYNFMRSRLVMGSMGLVYGGRSGSLWWLDFGVKPDL